MFEKLLERTSIKKPYRASCSIVCVYEVAWKETLFSTSPRGPSSLSLLILRALSGDSLYRPRARAAESPACVHSRMRSPSNSAKAAKILQMSLPCGVVVLMGSLRLISPIPCLVSPCCVRVMRAFSSMGFIRGLLSLP